jgi:hypothetical protein
MSLDIIGLRDHIIRTMLATGPVVSDSLEGSYAGSPAAITFMREKSE